MDYIIRQQKIQTRMKELGISGFLVTQNIDLFYFTGSMQAGYLFIPAHGSPKFYVRRSVVRAKQESYFEATPLGSFRDFGRVVMNDFPSLFISEEHEPVSTLRIASEFDVLPVQIYQRLEKLFPQVTWIDGSLMIKELRMIKSPDEIKYIKKSAEVVNQALEYALSHLEAGQTELELITSIEQSLRAQGHMGIMRMRGYNSEIITGMVASGASAAEPTYFDGPAGGLGLGAASPQGSSKNIIIENEPILIDIGCNINGYVIDQTRTAVIGQLNDQLHAAYFLSEQIIKVTEAELKPGISCEQLYLNALSQVKAAGLEANFMGYGEDQVKFLGHGIGLEIDEFPVLAKGFTYLLEPGMVIAIEPKFTFPGQGVVGIENTYAITKDGFEKLTISREGIIYL